MVQPLDFAWPANMYGRSSGWAEKRSPGATIAHPPIVKRTEIQLVPRWKALRVPLTPDGRLDFDQAEPSQIYIKVSNSPLQGRPALSSGASSALVREVDGTMTRIKRCGFGTHGVGHRYGFVGRIGMMGISEALSECHMLSRFRAQGLCPACQPISVDILADHSVPFFGEHASGVARVRVTSDVRADEWFLSLLAHELERAGLAAPVFVIRDDEIVRLREPAAALAALRAARPYDRVHQLGRGLGGLLRAVHDAGLLRGRGAVWMGNDIVGPDLKLSAIDCDGGAISGAGSAKTMRRIEAVEYAAGFADCFSWGQQDWLAEATTVLCDSFWEGYGAAAAPEVNTNS